MPRETNCGEECVLLDASGLDTSGTGGSDRTVMDNPLRDLAPDQGFLDLDSTPADEGPAAPDPDSAPRTR